MFSENYSDTFNHFNTKSSVTKRMAYKIELVTLFLLLAGFLGFSQDTYVPDDNFEQALIDLGFDDVLDDYVTTANISGVAYLNVSNKNISDLTGIEDFAALITLYCRFNQLTSLDISQNLLLTTLECNNNELTNLNVTQNTALENLLCSFNQLSSLDITQNTALTLFSCSHNQITSINVTQNINLVEFGCNDNLITGTVDVTQNTDLVILNVFQNQLTSIDITQNTLLDDLDCSFNSISVLDITQNTALTLFSCRVNQIENLDVSQNIIMTDLYAHNNQLTSLDVSQNVELISMNCHFNQLTSLNVKNGNNSNFTYFRADFNPNLTCIEVDDETFATTNWTEIDSQTSFSENCEELSINDVDLNESITIYPNPTSDYINISSPNQIQNVEIYDLLGKKVKQEKNNNHIAIQELRAGIYFMKIVSDKGEATKKIVIR